ncbi:MAG: LysM peptidoglycan-binding domain-containing protein, partial [Spirochaetota bacterium]
MQPSPLTTIIRSLLGMTILISTSANTYCAGNSVTMANNRPSGIRESYNSVTHRNSQGSASSFVYHTIQKGENLTVIARKYGTSVSVIKQNNTIKNPGKLYVGTRLKIPSQAPPRKTVYHTVQRGENLSSIAQKFNVSVADIKRNNSLKNPNRLYVGTKLKIPAAGAVAGPVTAAHRTQAEN